MPVQRDGERPFLIDCRLCLVQRVLWIYSYPLSFWPFKTNTAHYLSVWRPPVNNNSYYSEWRLTGSAIFITSAIFMKADCEINTLASPSSSLVLSLTHSFALLPDYFKEIYSVYTPGNLPELNLDLKNKIINTIKIQITLTPVSSVYFINIKDSFVLMRPFKNWNKQNIFFLDFFFYSISVSRSLFEFEQICNIYIYISRAISLSHQLKHLFGRWICAILDHPVLHKIGSP